MVNQLQRKENENNIYNNNNILILSNINFKL